MNMAGLLDDSWWNGTYWIHGTRWPGFHLPNDACKAGRVLVFDEECAYGPHAFRRRDRLRPAYTPDEGQEAWSSGQRARWYHTVRHCGPRLSSDVAWPTPTATSCIGTPVPSSAAA
jgi:hypothetical protein